MINPVPPAAILIAGALLVPFFKGRLKKTYLLVLPTLAFLDLLCMPAGKYWIVDFLNYELIFGRVDKLSMAFGYVFVLITFIGLLYARSFFALCILGNTGDCFGVFNPGPQNVNIFGRCIPVFYLAFLWRSVLAGGNHFICDRSRYPGI